LSARVSAIHSHSSFSLGQLAPGEFAVPVEPESILEALGPRQQMGDLGTTSLEGTALLLVVGLLASSWCNQVKVGTERLGVGGRRILDPADAVDRLERNDRPGPHVLVVRQGTSP
jgi:hypothetical protein